MGLSGGVVAAAATPVEATAEEALRGFLKESFLFPRGEEPVSSLLFMWSINNTPLRRKNQEPGLRKFTMNEEATQANMKSGGIYM